jgi:hypothetical protein
MNPDMDDKESQTDMGTNTTEDTTTVDTTIVDNS